MENISFPANMLTFMYLYLKINRLQQNNNVVILHIKGLSILLKPFLFWHSRESRLCDLPDKQWVSTV